MPEVQGAEQLGLYQTAEHVGGGRRRKGTRRRPKTRRGGKNLQYTDLKGGNADNMAQAGQPSAHGMLAMGPTHGGGHRRRHKTGRRKSVRRSTYRRR